MEPSPGYRYVDAFGMGLKGPPAEQLMAAWNSAVRQAERKPRRLKIPSPETITPTTPLRLAVAAELAFPDGSIGVSGLRKEIAKGNLAATRIAGKLFVTLADIEAMRKKCAVQNEAAPPRERGSIREAIDGSSSISGPTADDVKSAQAHLQASVQKLKKPSPNTSPKSTSPTSAPVIRLKS
jgi:hypothetical protein